jgi:deoxyinosine 3'endonuclease (endonuclease V)
VNVPSVGFPVFTVIVIVVVDVSYRPDSVGVSVAVIVAVPELPTSIVVPDTDATVGSDDEYAIVPATDDVGAAIVKSASP